MSQVTVANMCKKHGSTISTITCTLVDVESMPSPMFNFDLHGIRRCSDGILRSSYHDQPSIFIRRPSINRSSFIVHLERIVKTASVDVHTASVDVHTAFVDVHTASVDLHTAFVDLHTAFVDVHTPSVDVHTASVDVHTTSVDVHKH
ncbi:hypothetical protein BLOT_014867 [Blomia tropicalis]|nr:hypothetical protein BLOT_014867 [Blomia tropicalis]